MPITATFTSVSATTVALRGSPSRIASSPKYAPGPTRLSSTPSLVHDGLALEDDEERVARLALLDELDAGRQLGDLRVPRDRPPLPSGALREEPDIGQQLGELSLRSHLALPACDTRPHRTYDAAPSNSSIVRKRRPEST